jgi:hypothetical protein
MTLEMAIKINPPQSNHEMRKKESIHDCKVGFSADAARRFGFRL